MMPMGSMGQGAMGSAQSVPPPGPEMPLWASRSQHHDNPLHEPTFAAPPTDVLSGTAPQPAGPNALAELQRREQQLRQQRAYLQAELQAKKMQDAAHARQESAATGGVGSQDPAEAVLEPGLA